MQPGRGSPLLDLAQGIVTTKRAFFALMHGREFIGKLRLPALMNAMACLVVLLAGWFVLWPAYTWVFSPSWWLLDGTREHFVATGPRLWLLTTWFLLGPPLLDLLGGAAQEPLRHDTESMLCGLLPRTGAMPPRRRLADRVRVLGLAAAALPLALLLVLIPWVGLPCVLAVGSAVSALVWFEPPLAARGHALHNRLLALRHNRWRALGVGLGLQLAAAVPFVNVLVLLPIATIAAAASYLQFDKSTPRHPVPGPG